MRNPIVAFVMLIVVATLAGCGLLSPAVDQSLNKTGIVVLCSIEEEELNDPALNDDCSKLGGLTAEQKATIARHATGTARVLRRPMVIEVTPSHAASVDRALETLDRAEGGAQ